jgi:ArsR family transcriptional regulator
VRNITDTGAFRGVNYIQYFEYGEWAMDYQPQAELLKALAHPVRLQILDMLRQGEICVCHIERAIDKRQAYVSQQLMVLREAGLVESRKDGLQVYYRIAAQKTADLLTLVCGDAPPHGHAVIEGCPCPSCENVVLTTTHQYGEIS